MRTHGFKLLAAALFVAAGIAFTSCGNSAETNPDPKATTHDSVPKKEDDHVHTAYQCPMDCEKGKTYTDAGNCPVCKMELKKVEVKHDH